MESGIYISLIAATGTIVVAVINRPIKKLTTAIADLKSYVEEEFARMVTFTQSEVDRLEMYHINEPFEKKVKEISNNWIKFSSNTASTMLAQYMEQNVINVFREVAVPNFSKSDFRKAKKIIEAVQRTSAINGRRDFNEMGYDESVYRELDRIVEERVNEVLKGLEALANDHITNHKMLRIQEIFLNYCEQYSEQVNRMLMSKNL